MNGNISDIKSDGKVKVKTEDGKILDNIPKNVVKKDEDPKPGPKPDPKPGSQSAPKPAPKPGVKPEGGTDHKPAPKLPAKIEDIKVGDKLEQINDGKKGSVVQIDSGDKKVRVAWLDDKTVSDFIPIISFRLSDDKESYTNDDVSKLLKELEELKNNKQFNEKIIKSLSDKLRDYKVEREGIESEERQKLIAQYRNRKKELAKIQSSISTKKQEYRLLSILVKKELEKKKHDLENKRRSDNEIEQANLLKMRGKMMDVSKRDHERRKYQTSTEKDDEIMKLRTELEQYRLLSRLSDISEKRDKRSKKVDVPPIFERQTERGTILKLNRKGTEKKGKKKKGKRSVAKGKEKDPLVKLTRSLRKSLNKYLTV